jgi:anti-sigma factor RsiW
MECRQLTERAVDRALRQSSPASDAELETHVAQCPACASELAALESAWEVLGADPEPIPDEGFRRRTRRLLEDEMIRTRVREFRPVRRWARYAAQAAALLLAAAGGYLLSRVPGAPAPAPAAAEKASPLPDLAGSPRLSNVSYRPGGAPGRIAIEFDATTRHSVAGSPDDPELARLFAYLLARNAETAGEKSRAIELVSEHYGAAVGRSVASPDIVAALTNTLRRDPNPGVRKKAADALAGFRMTPEIRAALLAALARDSNPAVRLAAIEQLAAAARESRDPATIESLREKAFDPGENGFVRARAASALKTIDF